MQKKVENYIYNHLNPVKKNTDWTKGNFVQPLSIPEILAELQIADDYYRALPISKGILMMDRKHGKQIWIPNLFSMSTKQWHLCTYTFQKGKTSVHKLQKKQLRRLLRTICIIMKQHKQSRKPIWVNVNALLRRRGSLSNPPRIEFNNSDSSGIFC